MLEHTKWPAWHREKRVEGTRITGSYFIVRNTRDMLRSISAQTTLRTRQQISKTSHHPSPHPQESNNSRASIAFDLLTAEPPPLPGARLIPESNQAVLPRKRHLPFLWHTLGSPSSPIRIRPDVALYSIELLRSCEFGRSVNHGGYASRDWLRGKDGRIA